MSSHVIILNSNHWDVFIFALSLSRSPEILSKVEHVSERYTTLLFVTKAHKET